ncbi:MAG TPA: serine protease, partial [Nitrospira sp.]|nr:serine protease [Nitrospira sp.]
MLLHSRHRGCSRWPRLTTVIVSLGAALCPIFSLNPAHGSEIVVATYEGVINPVAAEYLHDALTFAQSSGAQALILKLDTPGGLDTSMRLMIKDMTASTTPVIVYVAPSGGRAASAGVFLTMAAHVAAMAPGTNIGAAHPVAMGGGEMDSTMKEKVENDAVAYIKSIADQHGRNVSWAEEAVRKSVSVTEQEAIKLKIIDIVAENMPALLRQLNGRKVNLPTGSLTLSTDNAMLHDYPMGTRLELLKILSDPNIAYLLMSIGTIGIMAELYSPGAILPGIIGAISLILAFYSLQSLPVNYAGALLVILGAVFLLLEISVTSYGLLALGGVAAMTLGGLLLIKS